MNEEAPKFFEGGKEKTVLEVESENAALSKLSVITNDDFTNFAIRYIKVISGKRNQNRCE